MAKRKICVVTGSRAEYGLLKNLMTELRNRDDVVLQVLATGMHLLPEFGMTVHEILADGFTVDARVDSQVASDAAEGMAKSLGHGIIGCTDAFQHLKPDIVVLLGDRYEILAAALGAALLGIPVAHISGGEITEGAVDDWIRHAITKASWWHFVAAESYGKRVIQLGETPDRVFNIGSLALDSMCNLQVMSRAELEADLGLTLGIPLFLATYHPATLSDTHIKKDLLAMLSALDRFPQATVVFTGSNADAGGREITRLVMNWTASRTKRTKYYTTLGQKRYLSVMRCADVVIGNSSSGVIEAPALKVATVNIGPRQGGRLRANSIVDCAEDENAISSAIDKVLSPSFRATLPQTVSPFGEVGAAKRVANLICALPIPMKLRKVFNNL